MSDEILHPLYLQGRIETLERALKSATKENSYLRALVQHNPNWKCTYGHDIPSMGHCPLGFPGCGCADDLLLGDEAAILHQADLQKVQND